MTHCLSGTIQVIVSVGGEDDKVVLRSAEFWDPFTKIWKTLACLPFAVSKHGLVVTGQGKMYMAGGEYPDESANRGVRNQEFTLQSIFSLQTAKQMVQLTTFFPY